MSPIMKNLSCKKFSVYYEKEMKIFPDWEEVLDTADFSYNHTNKQPSNP